MQESISLNPLKRASESCYAPALDTSFISEQDEQVGKISRTTLQAPPNTPSTTLTHSNNVAFDRAKNLFLNKVSQWHTQSQQEQFQTIVSFAIYCNAGGFSETEHGIHFKGLAVPPELTEQSDAWWMNFINFIYLLPTFDHNGLRRSLDPRVFSANAVEGLLKTLVKVAIHLTNKKPLDLTNLKGFTKAHWQHLQNLGLELSHRARWGNADLCDLQVVCGNCVFPVVRSVLQEDFGRFQHLFPTNDEVVQLNTGTPVGWSIIFSLIAQTTTGKQFRVWTFDEYLAAIFCLIQCESKQGLCYVNSFAIPRNTNSQQTLESIFALTKALDDQSSPEMQHFVMQLMNTAYSGPFLEFFQAPFEYTHNYPLLVQYGHCISSLSTPSLKRGLSSTLFTLAPNLLDLSVGKMEGPEIEMISQHGTKLMTLSLELVNEATVNLHQFENLTQLNELHLHPSEEGPSKVKVTPLTYPQRLVQLHTLRITIDQVVKGTLRSIVALPSLTMLNLDKSRRIPREELSELVNCKHLLSLSVRETLFVASSTNTYPLTPAIIGELHRRLPQVMITPYGDNPMYLEDYTSFKEVLTLPRADAEGVSEPYTFRLKDAHLFKGVSMEWCEEFLKCVKKFDQYGDTQTALAKSVSHLNRYNNVVPNDNNPPPPELGFYINLSPIPDIGDHRKRYLGQGPTQIAAGDFLSAAVDLNTKLIVMTAALLEEKTEKCFQYWPTTLGQSLRFTDQKKAALTITLESQESVMGPLHLIKRVFVIKKMVGTEEKTHKITHIQISEWLDGTLIEMSQLLYLTYFIEELENTLEGSSFYHCSAGAGRSALTLACRLLLFKLKECYATKPNEDSDILFNLYKTVAAFKQLRPMTLNNPLQIHALINFFFSFNKGLHQLVRLS